MRYPLAVLAAVACGFSAAAPVPKDRKPADDAVAIQGTWKLVKFDGFGAPKAAEMERFRLVIGDGKLVSQPGGNEPERMSDIRLDPSASPKAIDISDERHPALGIYELDGDTLRLCYVVGGPNAVRPTEFKSDENGTSVNTFRRMKEDRKEK